MMSSLYAGVSGLRNHQIKMNVIGNNIANVNTIGYKVGRVTFQEALVQTLKGAGRPSSISGGTNPVQMGLGMTVSAVDTLFQQGGLETTGQITDLAIQGSGFFILSDGNGQFYTRAGAFGFDAESFLVDPGSGLKVQGKMADRLGNIPPVSTIGDIRLPFGQQDPANETTYINLANNLNSSATDSKVIDFNAGTTGIDQVSGKSADGAGGVHNVTITGNQATRSIFDTGANLNGSMVATTTLTDMGVDSFDFDIIVDGSTTTTITGLTGASTVNDIVNAINEIAGINCYLDTTNPLNNEIVIERYKAGTGASYTVSTSAGAATDPTHGNVINRLFGLDGTGASANNGTNHTFVVTDIFTPTGKAPEASIDLTVGENSTTGMAEEVIGLGGGGITVKTANVNGLAAGMVEIETADTTHSTSITAYDSQGGKHTVIITFTKTTTNNLWDWNAVLPGNETILEGGSGEVRFNPDGSLLLFSYNGGATSFRFDPNNGAETMDIQINSGDTAGFNGLTGFSSPFTAAAIHQDGYGMGVLEKIAIDSAGTITGLFSNGVSRTLAQIILADFNNQGGLVRAGNSLYQVSANSGLPLTGVAGETISGSVSSGALESSNVDIATEFTNMITTQRGYQASSRIITTSDSMLEELVNLKR